MVSGDLLLHAIYRMIFVGDIVHCDLHPANVYVRNGRLILLDAGFSVELPPATKRDFARFFRALAFGESRVCADIMVRTASARRESFDLDRFCRDVDQIIAASTSQRARNFSVARFAVSPPREFRSMHVRRRHGIGRAAGSRRACPPMGTCPTQRGRNDRWIPPVLAPTS